ncbi:MAG: glycoside hydrolase family 3 C-terminal domain-containing protein [Bacteroidales bacterium]|nr:glycoside hydrolase family 3 C-terminal domain-containing protein [Bacteroidales bacterium]MBN2698834.1 glycoside hydrolase family 3 C-terminal domain-containing protein [Bacteroidales bacterium]
MKQLHNVTYSISKSIIPLLLVTLLYQCSTDTGKKRQEQINNIIASMTLEQKARVIVGTGMHFELPDSIAEQFRKDRPEDPDTAYTNMVNRVRSYLPGAAGFTAEYPGLDITSQALADGPAGLRISPERKGEEKTFYCTAFPIATLLACTWNTDLVNQVGRAMGEEVLEYGADIILGPGLNLQRDPLCGRNFEYFSEDPLVTGKMAAAMVKGIQSNGVGTSPKHFAANNQETSRMSVNTIVSERALREIYLRGFEIAVTEAQPWTIMSSYNKINGAYTSESYDLLTKILRDDWGFRGYVMTDWGGGSDVVAQMKAGNDMIMPGDKKQIKTLIEAVKNNTLEEDILDRNLARILSVMMKTPRYRGYSVSGMPDLEAHADITRKTAAEGMVLLENRDDALPLQQGTERIAVFGNLSYEFISGGTGSGDVNEAYTVSLVEGLRNAGLTANEELSGIYEKYIRETREKAGPPKNFFAMMMKAKEPVEEMKVSLELAEKMAGENDVALVTIGRTTGEGADRKAEPGDYYLTGTEKELLENISKAFRAQNKKVVVILNIGSPIETAGWKDYPDAILCAWMPGQEAGNSVADILTGKVNPSGKLAATFPLSYDDTPTVRNFPGHPDGSGREDPSKDVSGFSFMRRVPWEVVYEEDIYVGYRYYNTFDVPVAYEFGYGLSYTGFEYSNLETDVSRFKNKMTFSVDVKNTGNLAGREVVQVYVSAPEGKLDKPAMELAAFGKTGLLEPGEIETMRFTITERDLASFDETNSCWIVEPGDYTLMIGASSRDIRETAVFNVPVGLNAGTVSKALVPEREINRLSYRQKD